MTEEIVISVVIPTCNREESLLRTLRSIERSKYPLSEVIVVDSSDVNLKDAISHIKLNLKYVRSEKSVCTQRNIGISTAVGNWIFLCDDDIEIPEDYLKQLTDHVCANPAAGAVSGIVLQKEGGEWLHQYPISSKISLWWKSIFELGVWGEINVANGMADKFVKKGNRLSKAGWPVVIDFSGEWFRTPVYGLGASLVKKRWLLSSPYDETLDRSGIGDNYGVAMGFPTEGIHVLNTTYVYHHRSEQNRSSDQLSYYRRLLALDYFIGNTKFHQHVSKRSFQWSLIGNFLALLTSGVFSKAFATMKALSFSIAGKNPYVIGKSKGQKIVEPML